MQRVCRLDEIEDGMAKAVEVDGLWIALFRQGDDVKALLERCPHANGPMGKGWIEDGEAVCPLHHWRFDLKSGRCTSVSGFSLHPFRTEVREGEVYVEA
jgi:nitrite reductase (NADH) small subunit